MATIGDVAKLAGVSTTLVSRYLNQAKGVGAGSRDRIESAIKELHYVPDESARLLVRRRNSSAQESVKQIPLSPSFTIAFVYEDADPLLMSALARGIKEMILSDDTYSDYHLVAAPILSGKYQEADEQKTLTFLGGTAHAVIAVGDSPLFAVQLQGLGVPVILVSPERGAGSLRRDDPGFPDELRKVKELGKNLLVRVSSKMQKSEKTVSAAAVPWLLTLEDDSGKETIR